MDNKTKFGKGTFRHIRQEMKSDITNAPQSMPHLRKEIARVFQVANRRIQNVEKRGEFSPAVIALGKGDITGYSKFGMKGKSWVELKKEYAKAITFLRQPTSTATGVKEYNNHLKKTFNLTDEEYNLVSDNLHNKLQSISDSDYVERYLMRYKDFTGELKTEAKSVSHQLESDAERLMQELQAEIADSALDAFDDLNSNSSRKQMENVINTIYDIDKFGDFLK